MCEICDKIISAEKYEQSRNYLKYRIKSNCYLKRALFFDKRVPLF